MKKLLLGTATILAGLSAGVDAGVSITGIKHLEFSTAGGIVGRSEEHGYIVRQFGDLYTAGGFEVIDGNASFTQEEIVQAVVSSEVIAASFFENFPNLPNAPDEFSSVGLNVSSTNIEYLDIASELMANSEAKLRGNSIVLASGPGYVPKGVAGDYLVFSKGNRASRTVYRCKLSELTSNIDSYIETCDAVISDQNDEGGDTFAPILTRYVNNSGYVIHTPSHNTKSYSLIYPDGSKFSIPANSGSLGMVYISDEIEPTLHYQGQVFNLTDEGPVLNPIRSLPDNSNFLISENSDYNYYLSSYDAGLGIPLLKHTVCKKSENLSSVRGQEPKVARFTTEDAKQVLIEMEGISDPLLIEIINSYPNLPSDEALEQAGSPFYAGMTEAEYQAVLAQYFNNIMEPANRNDDIEAGFFAETNNLFCEDSVNTGHYPIFSESTPFNLLSDTGIYASPIGLSENRGFFLKSVEDGSGVGVYDEVAKYMLDNLSENKKNELLDSLKISNGSYFKSYPEYSALSFYGAREESETGGAAFDVTLEQAVDHRRAQLILKALGNDIASSSPLLGKDGVFVFELGTSNTNTWILTTSVTSDGQEGIKVNIIPSDIVIDPYLNASSQFKVNVSGSDIYGLDVSCNLSSSSLSVTQANYDGLFNSQNTMTLPLIYSASSITGTETLVAPELPFTGTGSFVLADIIADFTTEDVQITCAAEVSDENGQLLQVALTPATIRIDDGVHGGSGSVSGVIEIPGITDLSGVEVVLTIDGRQVTVMTDEAGRFEFDGLRDGEFTISLASENYVQSCQAANVADGGVVDLGSIELLAGDINADGNIDIADFTFMAARYRSNEGDADYEAKADLNKDGTINIQDLAILGSHFGSTQCNL